MVYRSVVYRNGIGVMNIQLGEEYKNAEKGEMERGFSGVGAGAREKSRSRGRGPNSEDGVAGSWGPNSEDGVGAGGRTRKMESEPGAELGRWSRSQGPNSEDGVGAGGRTRKMESEPGAELGRWSRSRGPREEGCSKEHEHEEEEGYKRT